jgi:hypothetical protein
LLHVAFRDEGGYELDDSALTPQLAREVDELLADCAGEPGLARLANDKILRRLLRQQSNASDAAYLENSFENLSRSHIHGGGDSLSRSGSLSRSNSDSRRSSLEPLSATSRDSSDHAYREQNSFRESKLGGSGGLFLPAGLPRRASPTATDRLASSDGLLHQGGAGSSNGASARPTRRKSDIATLAKLHARSRHARRHEQQRAALATLQSFDDAGGGSMDGTAADGAVAPAGLLQLRKVSSSNSEDLLHLIDDDSDNLSYGSGSGSAYSNASTLGGSQGPGSGGGLRRGSLGLGPYLGPKPRRRSVSWGNAGGEPGSGGSLGGGLGSFDGGMLATIVSPGAQPPRKSKPAALRVDGSSSGSGAEEFEETFGGAAGAAVGTEIT